MACHAPSDCQEAIHFSKRKCGAGRVPRHPNCMHKYIPGQQDRLLNKRRKRDDKAWSPARATLSGVRLFGCKDKIPKRMPGCKAQRARHGSNGLVLLSAAGDAGLFLKSCSRQPPIDFLNFYFQPRPEETAARLDSNVHRDSGFTLSPVGF